MEVFFLHQTPTHLISSHYCNLIWFTLCIFLLRGSLFLVFSEEFDDGTYKLRILPRTTEHTQNIYWHSQIRTVNWNTQMISIIQTPCTSNFQTPTQIITQHSDHNALYFHPSLIFNSRQVLFEKLFWPQKLTFLIAAESDPPCMCVSRL
jgi:hypothetical protein